LRFARKERIAVKNRQLVLFAVNGEDIGIDVACVKEIIKPVEIFKVINAPDYIEGLINLRGKIHAVFSLRKRFGLPSLEFDDNTKIILAKANSDLIGFIVDEVREIVRVEDENIEGVFPDMKEWEKKFVSGYAKSGDRTIRLLNLETALPLGT
jgi:purine-binding chemotaxis protein CheW